MLVGFFSAGLLSAFQSGDGHTSMLLTTTKLRQYQFDMLFMYVSRNMLVSAHIHKMQLVRTKMSRSATVFKMAGNIAVSNNWPALMHF